MRSFKLHIFQENVIANLSEDVLARNDKIALLENHINDLKEEVRQLHINLAEVVDTGEQLKDFSIEKMDSLKMLDAHRKFYNVYIICVFNYNRAQCNP